jgi:hypothetical protein
VRRLQGRAHRFGIYNPASSRKDALLQLQAREA